MGPAPSSPGGNDALSEDPLEIGETQDAATAPQVLEDDPEESLFLPEIDSLNVPRDDLLFVQPSDPPSSYRHYEAFSSSQVITGTAPVRQDPAQSDSYRPDAGDLSKTTTESAIEISAAPTSSSQGSNSTSIGPGSRSVVVIPDSQSQQASWSFQPSQTQKDTTGTSEGQLTNYPANFGRIQSQIEARRGLAASDKGPGEDSQAWPDKQASAHSVAGPAAGSDGAAENIQRSHRSHKSQRLGEAAPAGSQGGVPSPGTPQSGQAVLPSDHLVNREVHLSQALESPGQSSPVVNQVAVHESADNISSLQAAHPHIQDETDTESRPGPSRSSDKDPDALVQISFPSKNTKQVVAVETDFEQADVPASSSSHAFLTQIAPSSPHLPHEAQALSRTLPHSQPIFSGQSLPHNIAVSPTKAGSQPILPISPGQISSPFPSVPSQSLQQIGASAPPRPATPSSPISAALSQPATPSSATMSTSGGSKLGFAAQMKAMREANRAKRRAEMSSTPAADTSPVKPTAVPARIEEELAAETPARAGHLDAASDRGRSPSAVPAVRPVEAATQDEMNTSERYPTLVPTQQDRAALRRQSTITAGKPETGRQSGNSLHALPIALIGHQRDAYPTMINNHRDLIAQFLSSGQPDEVLISSVEELLERLRRLTVHPDLDNSETFTQYSVEPWINATWDVDCSVKFRFLKQLCERLRDRELTVAVVAQAGRLLEILETFFAGIKITCNRVDNGHREVQEGCALTINVLSSTDDASTDSMSADLVIALDGSAHAGCSALRLLQDNAGDATPLFVALVVPNTVEHIERCLSSTLSRRQRLRALVNGVSDLRLEAGKLEEGQSSLIDSTGALADYLVNTDADKEWPLATLSMLENLDSQTESDLEPPSTNEPGLAGEKRTRETDEMEVSATGLSKRQRTEQSNGVKHPGLPTTINPLDIEITHISDSISKPSQSLLDTSDLAPAPDMSDTEKRLHSLLQEAQARVAEHAQALAALQYRHEDQRTQLIDTMSERDAAIATAQKAVERMNDLNKTASALRAERDELKTNLMTCQAALLNHSVPERADFERLRQDKEQAVKEKADFERRLKTAQDDLDYARDMYQTSSSQAQALASQTKDLENRLSHTQNRATGEQARARQMTLDAQAKNMARENKQLRQRLEERETSLKLKDEELAKLREASRGRMGTRGSSVPRSPRMASPMKLAAGSPSSRQGSPAAGDLRSKGHQMLHPLRQG